MLSITWDSFKLEEVSLKLSWKYNNKALEA